MFCIFKSPSFIEISGDPAIQQQSSVPVSQLFFGVVTLSHALPMPITQAWKPPRKKSCVHACRLKVKE